MKNSLRLIAISVVVWFGSGAGIANAGVLDGQTVNDRNYFPNLTTPHPATTNGNHLTDSSVKVSTIVDSFSTIDFSSSRFVISDVSSAMDSLGSFNLVSNMNAAGTPSLVVDSNHLDAKRQNPNPGEGDSVHTVNGIPEPETLAMLIIGLGLMGYTVRRRRIIG